MTEPAQSPARFSRKVFITLAVNLPPNIQECVSPPSKPVAVRGARYTLGSLHAGMSTHSAPYTLYFLGSLYTSPLVLSFLHTLLSIHTSLHTHLSTHTTNTASFTWIKL